MPEFLTDFWSHVETVWNMAFFGFSAGRIILAFLILFLSYALRRFIASVFVVWLQKLTARTATKFDDAIVRALEKPMALAPIAFGVFLAARTLGMGEDGLLLADRIVQTLIAIVLFWSLARLVDPLASILTSRRGNLTETIVSWFRQALRIFFMFAGAAAILQVWGIPILPILASFSLLSVAIALGAQDLFKNLIAGATILMERRFSVGEWVKVEGVVEGTVERINFRSTEIRRFDKAPVQVPNAVFSDSAVTNFSRMTHRRIYWMIGLEYRTTVDQLREIRDGIEAYVAGNDDFAPASEASMFVRIDSFADSSINMMLYCFTRTTNWGEWLEIKEKLACRIIEIVKGAGAGFAFPSQSVYIEQLPKGAEVFKPEGMAARDAGSGNG
ncbi:MAG TPA: mechanosensitive ion channel family protein [Parvularculaceae bacterium]|nr:mechanosensitive ion channel family protein [Parvularculaceae bacterium]HRX38982.1 mechanosensitive ion channel family protein [Parvularculaceae bacterium]